MATRSAREDAPTLYPPEQTTTRQLAEAFATDSRLVDMPLYRLIDLDVRKGQVAGSAAVVPFVRDVC